MKNARATKNGNRREQNESGEMEGVIVDIRTRFVSIRIANTFERSLQNAKEKFL